MKTNFLPLRESVLKVAYLSDPKGASMPLSFDSYLKIVMDLYLRMPDSPCRISRGDISLVHQLWDRGIAHELAETAMLVASARRKARLGTAVPLGPIRSFHYFLPVIEELLENPLPDSYRAYLRSKVDLRPISNNPPTTAGGDDPFVGSRSVPSSRA